MAYRDNTKTVRIGDRVIGGGHRPHFVGEQIDDINKRILDFLSGI